MHNLSFYTVLQVSEILQVHKRQVYGYIHSGSLRAYRLGGVGDWRIPHEAVEEFLRISTEPVERDGYD
jgi:excisionase family DNA binding protein